MRIVIDIDEDVFTRLFDNGIQDNEIAVDDVCEMARALRLGRPLEAQPCEDCISREAVIEHICEAKECYKEECKGRTLERCPDLQWVFDLPSVTPQPKRGKWIEVEVHNCHATLKCSECDRVIEPTFTFGEYSYEDIKKFYPYCHCGCRMDTDKREVEE